MNILITGSSGLIGTALVNSLTQANHDVILLPRTSLAVTAPSWDPESSVINLEGVKNVDAVIHLAGDNVATARWDEQKKKRILDSRVLGTKLLCEYFAKAKNKPSVIVSASAIGYYGDTKDKAANESTPPGDSFLSEVCKQWEAATVPAEAAGIRVVYARIGTVLTPKGGALPKLATPVKWGVGGVIGRGDQYMSWVSMDDLTSMIQFVIENPQIEGPVNMVSPHAVANRTFMKTLGHQLKRPTLLPTPVWVVKLLVGEMAEELLLLSRRVYPNKLVEADYNFLHPSLEGALEELID